METIELHLDDETLMRARRLADARQMSMDELVKHALARLESPTGDTDPVLGMFSDIPDLVDEIVEEAMLAREQHSLRANTPG